MTQNDHLHDKTSTAHDSRAEITISEDKMAAFVNFYAPFGDGRPMDQDYIRSLLDAEGIEQNIHWDQINDAIFKINTERKNIRGVKAAEGRLPVSRYPEHYKLLPRFFQTFFPAVDNKTFDHKTRSPFILVRKGEKLGEKKPQREGIDGFFVTGEIIPCETDERMLFKPGENVYEKNGGIYSAINGQFILKDHDFWISREAHIRSNVDYHTGHLNFPGNVVIEGDVLEGFNVFVTGDLLCKQSIEAGIVVVKGNLSVAQGIIGKRKALIKIGGELETKFVENCLVQCRGDIKVFSSLINSKVYSFGFIKTGDKGHLVGGKIHAMHGIECYEIGNKAHVHTHVQCGTDFTAQQQLDILKQKQIAVAMKIQTLSGLMQTKPSPEVEAMIEKAKNFVAKINNMTVKLNHRLINSVTAKIIARGKVYPGTIIEICDATLNVTAELKASVFSYDPEKKAIIVSKA